MVRPSSKAGTVVEISASSLERQSRRVDLHLAWRSLIRYCQELDHGEIQQLKIQNGLPVLAEVTRKKVKFTNRELNG